MHMFFCKNIFGYQIPAVTHKIQLATTTNDTQLTVALCVAVAVMVMMRSQ